MSGLPLRPESRTPLLGAIVLVLLACVLHREVLFEGFVYHDDDIADHQVPGRSAFRRALDEGRLPSWEPGAFSGYPILASPDLGFFYPPNALFFLGPREGEPVFGASGGIPTGLGRVVALHLVLGGLGMLLLLRRHVSGGAAIFGAVAFALSSFGVLRMRHLPFVELLAWMPFVLLGVELALEGRALGLLLVGLAIGFALLTGANALVPFVFLPVAVYVTVRVVECLLRDPHVERRERVFRTLRLGLAIVAGAALAAVALAPAVALVPETTRALGTTYEFASAYALPDLRSLAVLLEPTAAGGMVDAPWLLPFNPWELAGYYVGVLAIPLALLGAFDRTPGFGRGLRLALSATVLFALATSLGAEGPTHRFLFEHVPGFSLVRCPARALVAFVLIVPILAALGAERLLGAELAKVPRKAVRVGGIVAAVVVVALAFEHARRLALASIPGDVASGYAAAATGHVVRLFGGLVALVLLRRMAAVPAAVVLALLVGLTAADELAVARTYLRPRPLDFPVGMERYRAIEWLLPRAGHDRLGVDPGGPFRLLNLGETVGLEASSGYGSVQLQRYARYVRLANGFAPEGTRPLAEDRNALALGRMSSPLVDLLGVRWFVGPNAPGPGFVLRYAPDPAEPPRATAEPAWDARLLVFENLEAFPRAFVVYDVVPAHGIDEEERLLAEPSLDLRNVAIVGGEGRVVAEDLHRASTPARIVEHTATRLVVEATAEADGVLVLGEVFAPGWSAEVDGRPREIVPVDLALRGVPIARGRHRVVLAYRDRAVGVGAGVSLLGLGVLAGVFAWGRRASRARAQPL